MFTKVLLTAEDYGKLPLTEWKQFCDFFDRLQYEKSLCFIENLFSKYPELFAFKYSFKNDALKYENINIFLYDNQSNSLLYPAIIEELKSILFIRNSDDSIKEIFIDLPFINKNNRFSIYRRLTEKIPEYNEVITCWENEEYIDHTKESIIKFQGITIPMRIVSSEQINTKEWNEAQQQFDLKNIDFGLLKCQQFFWSLELLFEENDNLSLLQFERLKDNSLKISVEFISQENNIIKSTSFERLNMVLDASDLLIKETITRITKHNRYSCYEMLYDNIKNINFSERVIESIINIKNRESV